MDDNNIPFTKKVLDKIPLSKEEKNIVSIYQVLSKENLTKSDFFNTFDTNQIERIFNQIRSNCAGQGKNTKDYILNLIEEQEDFLNFSDNVITIRFEEPETLKIENDKILIIKDTGKEE